MDDYSYQAFPVSKEQQGNRTYAGMTMREYYAGQALAGLIINPEYLRDVSGAAEEAARMAWQIADAMVNQGQL